jgi:hypothetical protein
LGLPPDITGIGFVIVGLGWWSGAGGITLTLVLSLRAC